MLELSKGVLLGECKLCWCCWQTNCVGSKTEPIGDDSVAWVELEGLCSVDPSLKCFHYKLFDMSG